MIYAHAFYFWFALVILGVGNGIFRVKCLEPFTGPYLGHVLSFFTFSPLMLLAGYGFARLYGLKPGQAPGVGFLWLIMTVGFEFLFGHFVMKHPWSTLLHDYNFLAGRLWLAVLFFVFVAPIVGSQLTAQ